MKISYEYFTNTVILFKFMYIFLHVIKETENFYILDVTTTFMFF